MTAVLRSPSHLPSSPSSTLPYAPNDGAPHSIALLSDDLSTGTEEEEEQVGTFAGRKGRRGGQEEGEEEEQQQQLSLLALLVTVVRKSLVGCSAEREKMEIGWPTNVRHVAHVTFDRFHGFLGLPVEFEPEVPRRAPSASASVFGVSAESMQCSFDSRGNSVPTILLLMQRRMYAHGGLQAEGIFRINAENSQEEHVRNQLNSGIVPDGIDVHCLAGLIKAWFRELPAGVLDCLSPEQVAQCQTEEECTGLVGVLPPTEAALLDWAVNLMADVVQEEHHNKMNARNIAMVFAPNMTQMDDPLTALMYAVQVMNFLKTLIERALKERQDTLVESVSPSQSGHSDENGHQSPPQVYMKACVEENGQFFLTEEPVLQKPSQLPLEESIASPDKDISEVNRFLKDYQLCKVVEHTSDRTTAVSEANPVSARPRKTGNVSSCRTRIGRWKYLKKELNNADREVQAVEATDKPKGISILSHINSSVDRVEAW